MSDGGQFQRAMILLSPLAVIAVGHFAARSTGHWIMDLAWLPAQAAYWAMLAGLVALAPGGFGRLRGWFQPSTGGWGWRLLSLITVLPVVAVTVMMARSFGIRDLPQLSGWLLLVLLNPLLEEAYWRGAIMSAAPAWPRWRIALYAAFWFAASHPLIVGVNIAVVGGWGGFAGTFFHGIIWAVVFWRTGSLRWPLFSHFLANAFSMAIVLGIIQFPVGTDRGP